MISCHDNVCNLFLYYLIPSAGLITGIIVFSSPLPTIRRIQRYMFDDLDQQPKFINPLPYALQISNAIGWITYGIVIQNYFVSARATYAFATSIYYTMNLQVYGFCLINQQNQHYDLQLVKRQLRQAMYIAFVFGGMSIVMAQVSLITFHGSLQVAKLISGVWCCIFYGAMFISPLSVMLRVYKQKSAELIYFPLAVTALVNGILWIAYGAVLEDPILLVTNSVATLAAIVQILLVLVYGQQSKS